MDFTLKFSIMKNAGCSHRMVICLRLRIAKDRF